MRRLTDGINVAVVGLGFGRAFLPIYQEHPDVDRVGICDTDPTRLADIGDRFAIHDRFGSLDEVLADDRYDAVHLLTPVVAHAEGVLGTLRAGKHCASAVPMATTLHDIDAIIEAQRASRKNYMMMETAVYAREFFYVREQRDAGTLGSISFLRGVHIQDLDKFPPYWWGFPPMHYATHALSPLLSIADARAESVQCLGSGRLDPSLMRDYDNPYPLESALFRLDRDNLAAEVTVSFFHTARAFQEGFSIYGSGLSVEWEQLAGEGQAVFTMQPVPDGGRGRPARQQRVEPEDRLDGLPDQLRRFARPGKYEPSSGRTVRFGAGHGGSHPHLVHEFVSSIVQDRAPAVDAATAARWTAPGICAHQSAMRDGELVPIPHY